MMKVQIQYMVFLAVLGLLAIGLLTLCRVMWRVGG